MKNLIKLVNNTTLFVEGATDRVSAAEILAEMTDESPLGLMFNEPGTLSLQTSETTVLNVAFRKIRLEDRHVSVKNMTLMDGGRMLEGVGIGLPDDAKRMHSAWVAATKKMPYNWTTFLSDYAKDLEKIGSLMFDHVDTARIDGMQAQVISHPLVGRDEVGLNTEMMKKLHKRLSKIHEYLGEMETIEGMWVLLQRQPVVGPLGARWVKLVLIKGAPSNKILVNAVAWKELHDGDEDGDGGYIGIGKNALFGDVAPEMEYPKLVATLREDLPEVRLGDPVSTVMGFLARELTGPQHTLFHGLARAAAVKAATLGDTPQDKAMRFKRACDGVFDIYHPCAEGTFDCRKGDDGIATFRDIVRENENHLKGGRVDETVFFPMLSEKQQKLFTGVMQMVGNSTNIAKGTIFGRVLMAGDNGKQAAFGIIVEALKGAGIEPEGMIRALQADGQGEQILPMLLPVQKKRRQVVRKETRLVMGGITNMKEVFECLTFEGRSVLQVRGMKQNEDGTIEVGLRLIPVWLNNAVCQTFSVFVPKIDKVVGTETTNHRLLRLPGMSPRMFCPIFQMVDDNVVEIGIKTWFAGVMKSAIESFAKRKGRITQEKLQEHMDRLVRKAVRDLVSIDQDNEGNITDAGARETMIRMFEWRVAVEDDGSISGRWDRLEEILNKLNGMGYDICTTSKNKPGTIVTKAWMKGIPRFLWAVNPFAADLDMKRRVEIREIRKALELAYPIEPIINTKGCKVPVALQNCLTMLNVAAIDLKGWNVFEGSDGKDFCFDTLLVTDSGVNKLAIKKLGFKASDWEEAARIVDKLLHDGFTHEQIKVEEVPEDMGDGLGIITYDIVAMGPVTDIGKIKAAVGPIKGVMNPVPFKMFSVDAEGNKTEIDLIVPHSTIVNKRAMDAVKYMMAANAGITEIDPDNEQAIEVVRTMVVLEDGTEIGECITGPLPFFRPVQTGRATADLRTGENGVKVSYHAMIMAKRVENDRVVDRIRFHNTPAWVSEDFAQIVNTRALVLQELAANTESDEEATAAVVEKVEALASVKNTANTLPYDENDPFNHIGN
jgi:hypothetical protein